MHVFLTMTPRAADISEDTDVRHLVDTMVDTSDLIALATPEKVDVAVDTRDGIDAGEPEDDLMQREATTLRCNLVEEFRDIVSSLCGCFHEKHVF